MAEKTMRYWLGRLVGFFTVAPKSKSVAVVLAAFFGPLAWLYVFDKSSRWKFWLKLALCVITIFYWYAVAWIWAIIDLSVKPISYYEKYGAMERKLNSQTNALIREEIEKSQTNK